MNLQISYLQKFWAPQLFPRLIEEIVHMVKTWLKPRLLDIKEVVPKAKKSLVMA